MTACPHPPASFRASSVWCYNVRLNQSVLVSVPPAARLPLKLMGLCRPSDITTISMSQSCVQLYECTKFGTNIVGEMCTNSVTWFCAYLCKTEDTVSYACCNIWCTTCSLLWKPPCQLGLTRAFQAFVAYNTLKINFTFIDTSICRHFQTWFTTVYMSSDVMCHPDSCWWAQKRWWW